MIEKIKYRLKNMDWYKFLIKATVVFVYTLLVFIISMNILASGSGAGRTSELDKPIASTVDLPTQIKELQLQQSLVLEKQLDNIAVSDSNENDVSETITKLNHNNQINGFMEELLSIKYEDNIDTQYKTLSKYLVQDSSISEEKTTVEEDTYKLLGGDSWSKETNSVTSKAGVSIISLLTGSNKNDRYYQVIVPATNDKRDSANLIYFIKTDNSGKIRKCVYGGVLEKKSNKLLYKDLSSIFD